MNSRSLEIFGRSISLFILAALIGCSSISHSSAANKNEPSDGEVVMEDQGKNASSGSLDPRLVSANVRFGFNLFSELAKKDTGKNLFISPTSIGLALAMTYNGAAGETKVGMERALEIQGMNHSDLNRAYAQLRAALESPDPKVQLNIANSLWARKEVTFNPDFLARNKQFYGAEVTTLDFNDPNAPATINSWVSDKTKGKIDKIIDRIDAQSILFLINAIYFKGAWTAEFDKGKTKDEPFTAGNGQQKQHPMMHQAGDYKYLEAKDFQAVSLPYDGARVSMYIFLPSKGVSLEEFQKNLTAENWNNWLKRFAETKGDIGVPRFKVEYEISLNEALSALGMGVAFDPNRADFSGVAQTSDRVFISNVKHKTFAEVNEEGTEAAAVTSVEMRTTSAMRPRNTFRMIVDRPFFCAIADNKSGTVLFMGAINNP
jgi:serine protease inhibitor